MKACNERHTPGPWKVEIWDLEANIVVACAPHDRRGVYPVAECSNKMLLPGEAQANAALIAQAPDLLRERDQLRADKAELLAALQNCLSAFETHYVCGEKLSDHYPARIERARAAIRKANGGQP